MTSNYSFQNFDKEHQARAIVKSAPVSFKQSVEICRFIRHKPTVKAKAMLAEVVEQKTAVPFKKFYKNTGHKKKIGPGRYPEKAATVILKLVEAVEANAQFKGLNTSNLIIIHTNASNGSRPWHFGRKRRRKMKRTNIEIVVEEKAIPKKPDKK
jgi:large subunit ribosomal protein L22